MKKFRNFSKKLFKSRAGQGATEYILLLVVVVALVTIFRNKISQTVTEKIEGLSSSIQGFSGE